MEGCEVTASFANPPAPHSIQKCPEPQICQKFLPTIAFRGSNQGDPNLSKISRTIEICPEIVVCFFFFHFNFSTIFRQIFGPPDWNPKSNRRDNFLTKLGFGALLDEVRGRRVRNASSAKS